MVTFKLEKECKNTAIYYYWTEDNEKKNPENYGVIAFDKEKMSYKIIKLAPSDFRYTVSIEEQLEMRSLASRGKQVIGKPPLTEEEWPMPQKEWVLTFYAAQAFQKIKAIFKKTEEVPIRGESRWY